MARLKTRNDWLEECFTALGDAFNAETLTLLDQLLFVDQYMNVLVGNDVHFPDIDDKNVRRLRSNRLKLLGYRWLKDERRWSRGDDTGDGKKEDQKTDIEK